MPSATLAAQVGLSAASSAPPLPLPRHVWCAPCHVWCASPNHLQTYLKVGMRSALWLPCSRGGAASTSPSGLAVAWCAPNSSSTSCSIFFIKPPGIVVDWSGPCRVPCLCGETGPC